MSASATTSGFANDLGIVGLSHRASEIRRIATVAATADARRELARRLRAEGCEEVLVLATCNRVEVIYRRRPDARVEEMRERVLEWLGPSACAARDEMFALRGEDAIAHLFHVSASLDSLVVGERQITGQLRRAVADADAAGTIGPRLRGLAAEAFRVARRVRRDTRLARGASVVSLAAQRLATRHADAAALPIALVGAGETVERAALLLSKTSEAPLLFVNRTVEKARALAQRFGGSAMELAEFLAAPPAVDAMLTATASPRALFGEDEIDRMQRARALEVGAKGRLLVVDLAVPFDVDEAVRRRDDVELVTIESLREEAARRAEENAAEIERAKDVVALRLAQLRAKHADDDRARALGRSRREGEVAALRAVAELGEETPAHERLRRWAVEASHRIAHAAANRGDLASIADRERARLDSIAPGRAGAFERVMLAIVSAVAAPLAPLAPLGASALA